MTKIVVLDGYTLNPGDNSWSELESLGALTVHPRTASDKLLERAMHADILLTNKTPIRAPDLGACQNLKFISVLATGYNIVDVAAANERGVTVSNVPSYGTDSVAQHVLALLLELTNHVGIHANSVSRGEWAAAPDFCYWLKPTVELKGKTLGIVGFGRIGQRVAVLAAALGMKVIYSARESRSVEGISAQHVPLEQLFKDADVVSLHCSQTEANLRFVNDAVLSSMKSSALLLNTARGTLIDEPALADALRRGKIAGAALDVLAKEPPGIGHPLSNTPNCIITPHIAWSSREARKRLMQTTVANVRAFLRGSPQNVVTP